MDVTSLPLLRVCALSDVNVSTHWETEHVCATYIYDVIVYVCWFVVPVIQFEDKG